MRQFWRLTALPGAHSCIVEELSAPRLFFSFIDFSFIDQAADGVHF
jgi:hypothetical protein